MNNHVSVKAALSLAAVLLLANCAAPASVSAAMFPNPPAEAKTQGSKTAVFAGGCFWGIEGVFERLKGVTNAVSGYSGGQRTSPSYEEVSTGETGHAESVEVTYDPSVIAYGTLLKVFFSVAHDPTQLNYQGPDHGTQYRSAIFYKDADQKKVAEDYIKILNSAKIYGAPIVTEVTAFSAFYPAEGYHQHFLDKNPNYPYIVYWDMPKIANLNKAFPELVARK